MIFNENFPVIEKINIPFCSSVAVPSKYTILIKR